jgi:hypothetical protein
MFRGRPYGGRLQLCLHLYRSRRGRGCLVSMCVCTYVISCYFDYRHCQFVLDTNQVINNINDLGHRSVVSLGKADHHCITKILLSTHSSSINIKPRPDLTCQILSYKTDCDNIFLRGQFLLMC